MGGFQQLWDPELHSPGAQGFAAVATVRRRTICTGPSRPALTELSDCSANVSLDVLASLVTAILQRGPAMGGRGFVGGGVGFGESTAPESCAGACNPVRSWSFTGVPCWRVIRYAQVLVQAVALASGMALEVRWTDEVWLINAPPLKHPGFSKPGNSLQPRSKVPVGLAAEAVQQGLLALGGAPRFRSFFHLPH